MRGPPWGASLGMGCYLRACLPNRNLLAVHGLMHGHAGRIPRRLSHGACVASATCIGTVRCTMLRSCTRARRLYMRPVADSWSIPPRTTVAVLMLNVDAVHPSRIGSPVNGAWTAWAVCKLTAFCWRLCCCSEEEEC
jgi:hypothetical protein